MSMRHAAAVLFALVSFAAAGPAMRIRPSRRPPAGRRDTPRHVDGVRNTFEGRARGLPGEAHLGGSPDLKGTCVIYRSAEEIPRRAWHERRLSAASPRKPGRRRCAAGTAPAGTTPSSSATWRGSCTLSASIPEQDHTAVSPQTSAPEDQLAADVKGIRAALTARRHRIFFSVSNPVRDLLVFWGPSPFVKSEDLLVATRTTPRDPGPRATCCPSCPGSTTGSCPPRRPVQARPGAPPEGRQHHRVPRAATGDGEPRLPGTLAGLDETIPLPSLMISRGGQASTSQTRRSLTCPRCARFPIPRRDPSPDSSSPSMLHRRRPRVRRYFHPM